MGRFKFKTKKGKVKSFKSKASRAKFKKVHDKLAKGK